MSPFPKFIWLYVGHMARYLPRQKYNEINFYKLYKKMHDVHTKTFTNISWGFQRKRLISIFFLIARKCLKQGSCFFIGYTWKG